MSLGTERVGLAVLAAAEVPNFLAGLLPSLMTIQRFGAQEEDRAALRRGMIIGSAMSLAVGLGASMVAHDPLPFVATFLVLTGMVAAYENAIRHPHPSAKPIDDQPANDAGS